MGFSDDFERELPEGAVISNRVYVVSYFMPDGLQYWGLKHDDGPALSTHIGLLEMAQHDLMYRNHPLTRRDD